MDKGLDLIVAVLIWGTALLVFLPRFIDMPGADKAMVGLANTLSLIARHIIQLQ